MMKMEDLMAVPGNSTGMIGKMFYYSIANLLVRRERFISIGQDFGFPKVRPAKDSLSGAYRCATSALKDRVTVRDAAGTHIYKIYCRENKQEDAAVICRELVKETLNSKTNSYTKLANILFDREREDMYYDDLQYDPDVDVQSYCEKSLTLFDRFRSCYTSDHVDSIIKDQLDRMQAVKISIHGNLYFIPRPFLSQLSILEDYISVVKSANLNESLVTCNSMYVAGEEEQREKMAEEFYANFRRDVEAYQEKIQQFLDKGGTSQAAMDRWQERIALLLQKKQSYEEVLRRQLDALDDDYAFLEMQAQELKLRGMQTKLKAA